MEMIKYTLMCKNGYLFKPDTHYLFLGYWQSYCEGCTILEHGTLSEQEYRQIKNQTLVNVYQDQHNNRMSIEPGYHSKYLSKIEDKTRLQSYAGCLKKVTDYVYEGRVHVK